MSCNLSAGRRASKADESRRMPRYSTNVVGPSCLSSAKGILSCSQTCEGAEVLGTLVVNRGADWAEAEYAVHIQFDHERVATQLHE